METKNMTHEETIEKVLHALETIRPFLNKDGGDIELIEVKEDIVYVKLQGNCNGCPMSFSTMKLGIESTVKQFAPHIKEVVNIA